MLFCKRGLNSYNKQLYPWRRDYSICLMFKEYNSMANYKNKIINNMLRFTLNKF